MPSRYDLVFEHDDLPNTSAEKKKKKHKHRRKSGSEEDNDLTEKKKKVSSASDHRNVYLCAGSENEHNTKLD